MYSFYVAFFLPCIQLLLNVGLEEFVALWLSLISSAFLLLLKQHTKTILIHSYGCVCQEIFFEISFCKHTEEERHKGTESCGELPMHGILLENKDFLKKQIWCFGDLQKCHFFSKQNCQSSISKMEKKIRAK